MKSRRYGHAKQRRGELVAQAALDPLVSYIAGLLSRHKPWIDEVRR
jgi:hypothetical protein